MGLGNGCSLKQSKAPDENLIYESIILWRLLMNKLINRTLCVLIIFSILVAVAGCSKKPDTIISDETLGTEYFNGEDGSNDGGAGGDSNASFNDKTEAPDGLQINQSSKGAKVVNNCYETGYPIAKEKVTLNVMAVDYSDGVDYNKMPFTSFVEAKFNVKLKFTTIQSTQVADKVTLAYTSGNMPDMFWGIGIIGNNVLYRYEKEGMAVALDGDLSKYTPNLNAMFAKRKDVKYLTTRDNGHIYTFPMVREDKTLWWEKLYINKTWLTSLGLSMPKTTDQFKEVLRAFKNNDPNGNGKADEIPLAFSQDVPRGWYGVFGLGTADLTNKDNNGVITYVPTNPKYRTAISYLADLFQEKLLYNGEMRSLTTTKIKSLIESKTNTIGVTNAESYSDIMSAKTFVNDYTILPPLDGTGNGTNTWSYRDVESFWPNWGQITKACKYPEIAARLLDYFYSTEGCAVALYGPYGDKLYWKYDSNGKPVINNNGLKYSKLSPSHGVPRYQDEAVLKENFFSNKEIKSDATEQKADEIQSALIKQLFGNLRVNYIYNYRYTEDEMEQINNKVSKNLYATTVNYRMDFIYGLKNINNDWDSYVSSINSQGASVIEKTKRDADARLQAYLKQ